MGNVTSNAYDSFGNLIETSASSLQPTVYSYDLAGRLVTATDPSGTVTSNTYDSVGNLIATASSLQTTAYSYDDENRSIATSNSLGQVTRNTYDLDGNLTETTASSLQPTAFSYNLDGQVTRKTDASGTATYEYDGYGRLWRTTDAQGNVTAMEYDADTEKAIRIYYPTLTREYTYDLRGRVTEMKEITSSATRTTSYTLNAMGQVLAVTDPLGRITRSEYDVLGRRIAEINALGVTNRFAYNGFGSLTTLTDAKGNQTTFDYDLNGRLVQKTYADNTTLAYEYDALGKLVKRTDAKGQITAYTYDLHGRLATNTYYASSQTYPASPVKTVVFGYDDQGRMTGWNDGQYSGSFTYDDTNKTRTVTVNYGAFSKTFTCQYNPSGRKTSFTGPDGAEIAYTYAANGKLTGIEIPGEGTIGYTYNGNGTLYSQTLPGGNIRYFGYDAHMSLVTNMAVDAARNLLMNRGYSRNAVGNILAQQTESGEIAYQYDSTDQLTGVTNAALGNEWFAYDPMGNRLASSNTILNVTNVSVYSANSLNQYPAISNNESQISLAYDLNGNITNQASVTETNTYAWDIENRLISFQRITTNGAANAQYTYDPFGRRLSKAVNGTTNYFCYADEGLIGEYDASGAEIRSYGYTPGTLWMNNPLWMRTGISTLNEGETNYLYYLNDHLGAPQRLVRKNGATAWAAVMDAFGQAHILPGAIVTNNLRFSSQYFDEESGLHYNTMRYYDPISGRYLSRDSLGEVGGAIDLFAFCANNPMSFIDTLGLFSYSLINQHIVVVCNDWSQYSHAVEFSERLRRLGWTVSILFPSDFMKIEKPFNGLVLIGHGSQNSSAGLSLAQTLEVLNKTKTKLDVAVALSCHGTDYVSGLHQSGGTGINPLLSGYTGYATPNPIFDEAIFGQLVKWQYNQNMGNHSMSDTSYYNSLIDAIGTVTIDFLVVPFINYGPTIADIIEQMGEHILQGFSSGIIYGK